MSKETIKIELTKYQLKELCEIDNCMWEMHCLTCTKSYSYDDFVKTQKKMMRVIDDYNIRMGGLHHKVMGLKEKHLKNE